MSPFVVGLVELDEQERLFLVTNFPYDAPSELVVDARVVVAFDEIQPGVVLPQFRLAQVAR
jgi:hypothetical protein